jgi:competence protein ComEC
MGRFRWPAAHLEVMRLLAVVVCLLVVLAGCAGAPVAPDAGASTTDPGETDATTPVQTEGELAVHFINVGQSVATLVVGPTGETMLIDSGHYRDDGEYVLAYLQRLGIDRIDYLVTSHNDADHIGGNAAVIDYYETEADGIGAVYDPGIAASTQTYSQYLDAVERHGVTLYETREGDSVGMEGVDVEVLGPPEPYLDGEDRNENSIVLKLSYGSTSFLFTGDAEADQEAYLVERYGEQLSATVLKAGHHGSRSSTGDALLEAAGPRAVVVSSAYDSQYGHPHQETLDRLAARSVPTYWTATHGNVVLLSDGDSVTVRSQGAAPTDPDRLRDGSPVELGSADSVENRATYGGQGTPVATDGSGDGDGASGRLAVAEINADAEGDDRENLNGEYVVLENTGEESLELSGWQLEEGAGRTYTFPDGFSLGPGERVTVYTGSGTDTDTELYWGQDGPVWNNDGDTLTVIDAGGDTVLEESYS